MGLPYFLLDWTSPLIYTEYAGCAITTGIPVKFGTAHGRSRPEVGSTKRIDAYGGRVVFGLCLICDTFDYKNIISMIFLRPKHNFFSVTVCRLHQYLPHSSEMTGLVP